MKKITFILAAVLFAIQLNAQTGVSISNTNADPDNSAMLDVQSTDKGVLIPRVKLTADLSSALPVNHPADGLLIYNTGANQANGFYYWTGTEWKLMLAKEVTGTDITLGSDAKGDIMYYNGTDWVRLPAGTSGQVLQTNGTGANPSWEDASGGATHYVGELYGGGIVFYVYDNGQHGLIASLDDLDGGSGVAWSATTSTEIGASAKSMTDGANNTAAIVGQDATAGYAATLCNSYTGGGFTDWYLPSNRELYLLCSQDILIDKILDNDGDGATNGFSQEYTAPTYGRYWSSTEYNNLYAWYYDFGDGYSDTNFKSNPCRVRAVRAF